MPIFFKFSINGSITLVKDEPLAELPRISIVSGSPVFRFVITPFLKPNPASSKSFTARRRFSLVCIWV